MLITVLISQFEALTLPKALWTHEAHLRVGTWYVYHLGRERALQELRRRIRAYNEAVGVANSDTSGYHETITCCYVAFIEDFVNSSPKTQNIDQLSDDLIEKWGERDLLLRFYSKERLMSTVARQSWVAPDLKQFPFIYRQ